MPRFSNVQIFSDKDTKLVSGYVGQNGSGGENKGKLDTEKVVTTTGSCAGAGSGEFDLYRAARNRERERLEDLDAKLRKEAEEEVFAMKVSNNKRQAEERTEKNRLKRQKKKAKSSQRKSAHEGKKDGDASSDSETECKVAVPGGGSPALVSETGL
jgi:hypothetical protein